MHTSITSPPSAHLVFRFIFVTLLIGCAPASTSIKRDTESSPQPQVAVELVRSDGTYRTVPLEKKTVNLTLVQSKAEQIKKLDDAPAILKRNLDHMIKMGTEACARDKKPDILLFHEFPLTGYFFGKRARKLEVAIEIPGPETKALGQLAAQCDTYLVFGSYAKDKSWPGHILSINTVIGRDGRVGDTLREV